MSRWNFLFNSMIESKGKIYKLKDKYAFSSNLARWICSLFVLLIVSFRMPEKWDKGISGYIYTLIVLAIWVTFIFFLAKIISVLVLPMDIKKAVVPADYENISKWDFVKSDRVIINNRIYCLDNNTANLKKRMYFVAYIVLFVTIWIVAKTVFSYMGNIYIPVGIAVYIATCLGTTIPVLFLPQDIKAHIVS